MPLDPQKPSLMMEFKTAADKCPSIDDICAQFNLAKNEIDENYSVIPLETNGQKTFIALIDAKAGERIEKSGHPDLIQN